MVLRGTKSISNKGKSIYDCSTRHPSFWPLFFELFLDSHLVAPTGLVGGETFFFQCHGIGRIIPFVFNMLSFSVAHAILVNNDILFPSQPVCSPGSLCTYRVHHSI